MPFRHLIVLIINARPLGAVTGSTFLKELPIGH